MWQVGIEVRKDMTAAMLRKKSRGEKNGRVAARMLGIANILDGMERGVAARAAGMSRQTLCDWVHRYNKGGLEGLHDRPKGRPDRSLTIEQEKDVEKLVLQGPENNLVRWRCIDLKREIEKRFGIVLHERSVGKLLYRLGFRRLSVRPVHPKNDPETVEAFKKTSQPVWQKSSQSMQQEKQSSSGSKTKRVSDKKVH